MFSERLLKFVLSRETQQRALYNGEHVDIARSNLRRDMRGYEVHSISDMNCLIDMAKDAGKKLLFLQTESAAEHRAWVPDAYDRWVTEMHRDHSRILSSHPKIFDDMYPVERGIVNELCITENWKCPRDVGLLPIHLLTMGLEEDSSYVTDPDYNLTAGGDYFIQRNRIRSILDTVDDLFYSPNSEIDWNTLESDGIVNFNNPRKWVEIKTKKGYLNIHGPLNRSHVTPSNRSMCA